MDTLTVLHALYLLHVLVLMSWAAFRTRNRFQPKAGSGAATRPVPSRVRILTATLVSLSLLLGVSWMVARLSGVELFALPALGAREIAAALVVFAGHFALRRIAIAMHTREELRKAPMLAWMPRTPREWVLWVPVAILAGLAEEASYRGVAWTLLTWYTGNAWLSAALCIVAFGFAHITQNWKSALVIGLIAAMMHGLVAFTHTLVLAMIVHAAYDLVVAVIIGRRVAQREREEARAAAEASPLSALQAEEARTTRPA